jgi:parallel beta-helix repeat protein
VRITIDPNTGLAPNGTQILGNWIGLASDGTTPLGNTQNGVYVANADSTQIGNPSERNIISGNTDYGIFLYNTIQTTIASNYIGIAADGETPDGNKAGGVIVEGGATNTTIGGASRNLGNVISGNTGNTDDGPLFHNGITLVDCSETTIAANYIGTDAFGTRPVQNSRDGIYLTVAATMNTIGLEVPPGEQLPYQVISANGLYGIEVDGTNNTIDFNLVGYGADLSNLMNGRDWRLDDSGGTTNTWGPNNLHNP